jgi:hypothetical protein
LVWQNIATTGPPLLSLRQSFVTSIAVAAVDDVAASLLWRADWLAREAPNIQNLATVRSNLITSSFLIFTRRTAEEIIRKSPATFPKKTSCR